jgi:acyl-CoA synthetase (AMP-forming)/AMP-acid ligase II
LGHAARRWADWCHVDRGWFIAAEQLVAFIEAARPTLAAEVPTVWSDVMTRVRSHGGDVSSLHTIIGGTSLVSMSLQRTMMNFRAKQGRLMNLVEVRIVEGKGELLHEAAVIGIPVPKWHERPMAIVVLVDRADTSVAELREHISGSFARWPIPDAGTFVDVIRRTSVGKFDKRTMRAQLQADSYVIA